MLGEPGDGQACVGVEAFQVGGDFELKADRVRTVVYRFCVDARAAQRLAEPDVVLRIGDGVDVLLQPARESALEIVDTRYEAYKFKAADNIADNSSAARFVIGPAMSLPPDANLATLPVRLCADGDLLGEGSGADALGDPLAALAWLAGGLLRDGAMLREGDVVLTGGLTRAFAAQPGMRFSSQVGDPAQGGGEAALRFL